MRIAIGGTRSYEDYISFSKIVDACISQMGADDITILSGGCKGVDRLAEIYAIEHAYTLEVFPARWETYGKAAGPVRNKQMASSADCVIVFWDGISRGTASLISCSKKLGKPVFIYSI